MACRGGLQKQKQKQKQVLIIPPQLLARAFEGVLERTGLAPEQVLPSRHPPSLIPWLNLFQVDYLCAGTVQQEVRTSNVAKEAAFISGILLHLKSPHLQFQPR